MAAPVLTIDASNVTAYIAGKVFSVSLNTLDVTLIDPPSVPALGDAVSSTNPTWAGTVVSVTVQDNDKPGHAWVKVTAKNDDVAGASAAPFDLVDTDHDYRKLSITRTLHGVDEEIRGSLETFLPGLVPGATFELTSATHSFTAEDFTITEVQVNWLNPDKPLFKIDFGDPMVTMSVWLASGLGEVPDGSISGTKITDGSVTTPKIAANAITTALLDTSILIDGEIHFTGGQYLRGGGGSSNHWMTIDANGAAIGTLLRLEATSGRGVGLSLAEAGLASNLMSLSTNPATITMGDGTTQDISIYRAAAHTLAISSTDLLRVGENTSFPASPATNDLFYRTDLGMWFYYDGTRWLSATLYTGQYQNLRSGLAIPIAASDFADGNYPHPTLTIWMETLYGFFVTTTNDGTKYWTAADLATGAVVSTISNSANAWVKETVAVNTAVGNQVMGVTLTRVSTAGTLYFVVGYTYRLIAT